MWCQTTVILALCEIETRGKSEASLGNLGLQQDSQDKKKSSVGLELSRKTLKINPHYCKKKKSH